MSIASRITSIEEHIGNAYDSIKKFGVDTSVINKNIENIANVINDDIYDKLPKVTGSGSDFTLTPVQNGQVDDFKMNGVDLEQNTTNGNQLLNFNLTPTKTSATTSTFIDDTLTVSSSSGTYKRVEWDILSIIKNNPSRVIKFGKQSYSSTSNLGNVQLRIKINNTNTYVQILNNNYTIPSDTTTITEAVFQVYSNNSETSLEATTTIVKPLLYFDNNNTYEPYTGGIPSPNPDYPQEIKVVEGRQVVTDKGKNLLDSSTIEKVTQNGITCTYDSNKQEITFNGTCTYDNTLFNFYNTNILAKKDITKIIVYYVSGSVENYATLRFFDKNYVYGAITDITPLNSSNTKIVTPADDRVNTSNYVNNSFRFNNGSVANNFKIKIMVTDDDNTDYEPYYEPVSYNIDLSLENIQLAKMPNTSYKNRIYKNNGNWYFERNVEKYIIDGTESWTTQSAYSGYYRYMFVLMENYKNDNLSYGVVGMNSHFIQRITQPHGDYEYLYLQAANNNLLSVYIQIKNLSTIANFKTWLSENNVVVWYPLVNPVTTQITNTTLINQLEAISVHTGTNIITISNDNNIIPEIEITRLKELEKLA